MNEEKEEKHFTHTGGERETHKNVYHLYVWMETRAHTHTNWAPFQAVWKKKTDTLPNDTGRNERLTKTMEVK